MKQKQLLHDPCTMIHDQSGQSLIETLAAIFLLTMALTTALGLAIYAFSRSSVTTNEIIATNLAREGIDVVRSMRDSNWLSADAKDPDGSQSWGLQVCDDIGSQLCYPTSDASIPSYNDSSYDLVSGNHRVIFDSSGGGSWSLNNSIEAYDLYLLSNGHYISNQTGTSQFARMINISYNSSPPFSSANSNRELIIKSVVAWRDKNCPNFNTDQDLLAFNTPCKIVLEEHLTNWKDY